ncbi:MAG: L,D-transpeptidase family protein [Kiritimatiellae bacterium]|nr:L,D-transpeptidase family protein [Kiritimatiellia bacterium]
MRLEVNDFDNYRPPARLPWLPIVLVLVGVVLFLTRRDNDGTSERAETDASDRPVASDASAGRDSNTAEHGHVSRLPVSADVSDLLARATALAKEEPPVAEALLEARQLFEEILEQPVRRTVHERAEKGLGDVNIRLTMSPMNSPEKEKYVVRSGDSLDRIAKKFGTTIQLVQRSNMIMNRNLIRKGDNFLVFNGSFRLEVSKTRHDMVLYLNDKFFKRYRVGTGKFGRTPVGTFEIVERISEPTWWRPDGKEIPFGHPENILGIRWMEIRATGDTPDVKGYGIHGTWQPESIGKAESAGCIRMINDEVAELFDLLPLHTAVVIVE